MNQTPNYKNLKTLVTWPWRALAASLVHILGIIIQPEFFLNFVVKRFANSTSITGPVIHKFLNYNLLNNVCYLANTEFEQVLALDEELIVKNLEKLHVYFAHTDAWVNKEHATSVRDLFKKHGKEEFVKIEEKNNTRHAFVIYEDDIPVVAEWIASFL